MEKSTLKLTFLVTLLVFVSCFSKETEAARVPTDGVGLGGLASVEPAEGEKRCSFWWQCSQICPPGCDGKVCYRDGRCGCTC
ncbi:hypothetical protein FF1_010495 [Malus domestica]